MVKKKKKKKIAIPKPMPSLIAAVICEKVLIDRDGSHSVIRMIDRTTLSLRQDQIAAVDKDGIVTVTTGLMFFIAFRAELTEAQYTMRMDILTPSGRRRTGNDILINLVKDKIGTNVSGYIPLIVNDQPGIYWYEILLDDVPLIQTPLEIQFEKKQTE